LKSRTRREPAGHRAKPADGGDLPALPADKTVAARMVAAAIGLALREATAGRNGRTRWGNACMPWSPHRIRGALQRLSEEIRDGLHDPGTPSHAEVAHWLHDYARLRATVSAPKALR
jgi:hypothetical protein